MSIHDSTTVSALWRTASTYFTLSVLQGLLQEVNCTVREFDWPDYWYFGNSRQLVSGDAKVSVRPIRAAHRCFPQCCAVCCISPPFFTFTTVYM